MFLVSELVEVLAEVGGLARAETASQAFAGCSVTVKIAYAMSVTLMCRALSVKWIGSNPCVGMPTDQPTPSGDESHGAQGDDGPDA